MTNGDTLGSGEGGQIRVTYPSFLRTLQAEVLEAVREAENAGWHHLNDASLESKTYDRLLTWQAELDRRVKVWYNRE